MKTKIKRRTFLYTLRGQVVIVQVSFVGSIGTRRTRESGVDGAFGPWLVRLHKKGRPQSAGQNPRLPTTINLIGFMKSTRDFTLQKPGQPFFKWSWKSREKTCKHGNHTHHLRSSSRRTSPFPVTGVQTWYRTKRIPKGHRQ